MAKIIRNQPSYIHLRLRRRQHLHPRQGPRSRLIGQRSFTEAFLLQALGKRAHRVQRRIVNAVLVTIMEHGLVPSAVVSRLTHYGAPESYQGAVAAGLLGVGDRYAGTASECGSAAGTYRRRGGRGDGGRRRSSPTTAQRRRPLPGFGHPIHADTDPRVKRGCWQCARRPAATAATSPP
jgi:citrate synthase